MFQLNRQLILTARKLEQGPLENYTHMATLIHKMNLLLLEFETIPQLKNSLKLIFSKKLLNTVVDFVMNTDNFANFGIRFLEIMALEYADKIVKSEILGVVGGLLRTNDYETVAQSLSFISVLCESASISQDKTTLNIEKVLNKKLLVLIMKVFYKTQEIEYLHYVLQIVNHAIMIKELRTAILTESLKPPTGDSAEEKANPYTYAMLLKNQTEKTNEVLAISRLHQKVIRQRRELESWASAKK